MSEDLISLLKKRNQELLLLLETSRTLTRKLNIDELLTEIMHQATKVVNAESSSLMLIDEDAKQLVFDITMGKKGDKVKQMRIGINEGIAGWVAGRGEPLIVNDVSKDNRFNSNIDNITKYKTKSILCVPLKIQDKNIGVMEAINKKEKVEFDRHDMDIFSDFAAHAAVAIYNAKLFVKLEQEKEKIEAMFSGMGDGAVFTNAGFNILMINQSACNLLNINKIDTIGCNFMSLRDEFDFIDIENIEKDKSKSIFFDLSRRKGKKLFISCRATRIVDQENKTIGFIMIFRDVTVEKLELMMTRDFFSFISHKLKTPLVSITGYTPMLLKENEFGSLNNFQRSAIKAIDEQGRNLQELIEKILTFTSIGTGEMNLNIEEAGLKDIIQLSIKKMQGRISGEKVEITLDDFVLKNPRVYVDKAKLAGVMVSLIENAIKFNSRKNKKINIFAEVLNDNMVKISVQDNGFGIPSEEYENIFRKFYQVEEYFTGQVEGAGLGLAFIKEIIEAHKGTIEVKSKLDEGSIFSFTLPMINTKN